MPLFIRRTGVVIDLIGERRDRLHRVRAHVRVVQSREQQRSRLATDGIGGLDADVLAVVAALARQREVAGVISTAGGTGDDMLDRERIGGEAHLTAAVLAAPTGSPDHGLPDP